jgi:uncharacterized membrane protein
MAQSGADTHAREEAETEFTRIVAFTDGVFAIAITLLVLTLEIPATDDLAEQLSDRSAQFFAYFLSFAVLARFWLAHHRFYGAVSRFDSRLIALNMFYLAFVTLLPFTTEMLGNYSDDSLGVALYAANLTIVSASFVVQIKYCYAKSLMREDASDYEVRFAGPANWAVSIVFGLSIPIAFISPTAAQVSWLLLFVLGRRVGDRLSGVRAPT